MPGLPSLDLLGQPIRFVAPSFGLSQLLSRLGTRLSNDAIEGLACAMPRDPPADNCGDHRPANDLKYRHLPLTSFLAAIWLAGRADLLLRRTAAVGCSLTEPRSRHLDCTGRGAGGRRLQLPAGPTVRAVGPVRFS